ncbi:hypothetical protein [Reinekea blandensis]|uniref:Uncharacterized protein n=1 Tax=Reinekea blandensis MED297 TaxID=314283 RepID=A4B9N5_9GAMM|nr:hypothetical protein [Reinekea blandensis]EAR11336.1 hypothetical protein MED297_20652 [Reinekea sp. MED297] [Reinekea blandensis MED297]
MKVSQVFDPKPEQWGLRGDPYLWDELKEKLENVELPESEHELKTLIETEIERSLANPITYEGKITIDRFKHGGMSSGGISLSFWKETGIPLLISRCFKS